MLQATVGHSIERQRRPRADAAGLDPQSRYAIAYGHYRQGRYEMAAEHPALQTRQQLTNPRFLKGLGASQFMARQFGRAATTYVLLILLQPRDAEALYMYGHALLMLASARARRPPCATPCKSPTCPASSRAAPRPCSD